MTTPLCGCPEDVGWVDEASWPFGDKTKAERIWCVNGLPGVRQYPQFVTSTQDASVTVSSGRLEFSQLANPGAPAYVDGPGAVIQPSFFTNVTSAPQAFMLNTTMDVGIVVEYPHVIYCGPLITASGGGISGQWGPMPFFIGGEIGPSGAFRQYTFTTPIGGRLNPGETMSITQSVRYFYSYWGQGFPGAVPPLTNNYLSSISLVTRFWGGNVNP